MVSINKYNLVIASDLNELQRVEKFTEDITLKMNFIDEVRDSIAISITEIVGNAISHGNKQDKSKKVYITYEMKPDRLIMTIQDEGAGFNVSEIDDPLEPKNLLKDSGRGIYIVKTLMDKVVFENNKQGTLVRVVKKKT